MSFIAKIMRRLREDHEGRRQGASDRRQSDEALRAERERRQGPSDRRQTSRRRVPEPEPRD